MPEIDARETFESNEEATRIALTAHQRGIFSTLRVKLAEDSQDGGHTVTLQPVTQMNAKDQDGNVNQIDLPQIFDSPAHFTGGGLMVATHALKKGDEGTATFSMMPMDTWHQSGEDTSQQIDSRTHSLSDASFHPGGRSDPNKLQQVDPDSHQIRSVDKKIVHENHPTSGTTIKHADPSTQAASEDFDPFKSADKYFGHMINPTDGHKAVATDGGTTHSTSLDHDNAFKASADNDKHTITAHPQNGTGVTSSIAHTVQAPNWSLDKDGDTTQTGSHQAQGAITSATSMGAPSGNFPTGSIGGLPFSGGGGGVAGLVGALAGALNGGDGGGDGGMLTADALDDGAASDNVGQLGGVLTGNLPDPGLNKSAVSLSGGDLGGTLDNPTVIKLGHVNAGSLPIFTGNTAAKNGGLPTGALYLNQTISGNNTVLCVVT